MGLIGFEEALILFQLFLVHLGLIGFEEALILFQLFRRFLLDYRARANPRLRGVGFQRRNVGQVVDFLGLFPRETVEVLGVDAVVGRIGVSRVLLALVPVRLPRAAS